MGFAHFDLMAQTLQMQVSMTSDLKVRLPEFMWVYNTVQKDSNDPLPRKYSGNQEHKGVFFL